MKRPRLCSLPLLLFAGLAGAADNPAPTVQSITENHAPSRWTRWFRVKTPSILRVTGSRPVPADVRAALDNYDKLLELGPEPQLRAEALRRSSFLRLQLAESGADADGSELRKAIAGYERLLAEQPDDPNRDLALYQLARAYQFADRQEPAIARLAELSRTFPKSPLLADAAFRAAELLFARGRYQDAEPEYRAVLDLGAATPFFDLAQYKYGWALYKQGKYEAAVPAFFALLDRALPPGELSDPAVLAAVPANRAEMAGDSLRVVGLSFAALGGGPAVNAFFGKSGSEPRYATLIYDALGALLLDKRRYTDAAGAYTAFVDRHPAHPLAPQFDARAMAALRDGGFGEPLIAAKERYVRRYESSAPYWAGRSPTPEVREEVRAELEALGRYWQAKAQQDAADETKQAAFAAAAGWYRKLIDGYPQDPKIAEVSLLYADTLYDGGRTREAALQYQRAAYGYAANPQAPEAAYAAVQAWQRLGREVPASERPGALRDSVAASLKLADAFPGHAQLAPVLTRAGADLYELRDLDAAINVARRVLQANPPAATELRREALGVVADARFAQKKYADAESAYGELLKLVEAASPQRKPVVEQLAASIYKQGEAARAGGDLRAAAEAFRRVGRAAPDASIRASADYDAASAFVQLQDWPAAEAALEGFRSRFPQHALVADADKKLALAYQKDDKPAQAGEALSRIAARGAEAPDTRREAAWLAAQLYDRAGLAAPGVRAYEYYLATFPQPLDRGQAARRRLADLALNEAHDEARYLRYLRELVDADAQAPARSEASKQLAAQASLEIGRSDALKARLLALSLPVEKSLPRRKAASETAIATLNRAAAYGYADVTTAATFEIGGVYRDFGRALLDSQRPARLKGEELQQYQLLLEEQADPFEQKAVEAYLVNVQRVRQGVWNDWVEKSALALTELAPGRYGKHELREDSYDSLR